MCSVALRLSTVTLQNAMKYYTHLTQEQRYHISAYLKNGYSLSQIARELNVHKSTISREIVRNKGKRGYRPKQAEQLAISRKANNSPKITDFGWAYIAYLLKKKYSPEQITGRLRYLGWKEVPSPETIYRYIYENKRKGGTLYQHLRGQKTYRKRGYKGHDRRGQLCNRTSIDYRPEQANQRQRLGDYEGDTMVGKNHKGALLTLVDRVSREVKITAMPNRKASRISQLCVSCLKRENVASITFDNGKEFAQHEYIARKLNTNIYFAHPYHSWERGTNENTNRLIRQYLPKSRRLDTLTEEEVQYIEDSLNNRPRKVLGFRTPLEVKSSFRCVALRS